MNQSDLILVGGKVADLPAYSIDLASLGEALRINLGPGGLTPAQLPRIHVPTGGGTSFNVVDADGQKQIPAFTALVLNVWTARVYWPKALSNEKERPACSSNDGITGVGVPGGSCAACALAKFGSAIRNGEPAKGQACREQRLIYLLRTNASSLLPECLVLPPTSLTNWTKFQARMTTTLFDGKATPMHRYIVEFSLQPKGTYSVVNFRASEQLPPQDFEAANAVRNLYTQYLEAPKFSDNPDAYYDNPNPAGAGPGQTDDDGPF